MDIALRNGSHARLPGLPLKLSAHRLGVRREPPRVGEHSREVLSAAGVGADRIDAWMREGVIAGPEDASSAHQPAPAR
jgi:crotonobetainyl-CoA:carnitine CoA-transferase CaiB-like acyl-CoA transferase